jgi:PfaD family protein
MLPNSQLGWWIKGSIEPILGHMAVYDALNHVTEPVHLIKIEDQIGIARGGRFTPLEDDSPTSEMNRDRFPWIASVPGLPPARLGSSEFIQAYGLDYPYVMGAMANGITSVQMVAAAGDAGMLAFFGAAGLSINQIQTAIHELQDRLPNKPYGFNLIHSPTDPNLEMETARLYIRHGVHLISASAFMDMTLPLVYYRVKGITKDENDRAHPLNRIVAKISREEVARKFLAPPPDKFIKPLLERGLITAQEAQFAREIPMADALTAEADSGGHTDNRPALALLPTIQSIRDAAALSYGCQSPVQVGLGGGIATPESAAAAFAMGADYIVTGSVNQACLEAGTSDLVRQMLCEAGQADVTMAPAADMFEMGVKVQVLKRGTMFPLRAAKLYDLYSTYDAYENIPETQRQILERDFFRRSFSEEWAHTKIFFNSRDPRQVERAHQDPKHKMALVFRSYLGQSSTWANKGEASRKIDYQIWCGPAIGAFNQWAQDSFLQLPQNRKVVVLALNILVGAAIILRRQSLRQQGIQFTHESANISPRDQDELAELLEPSSRR